MQRELVRKVILEKLKELIPGNTSFPDFSVEVPEGTEHGDYSTNIALVLAKVLKRPPMDIAREITQRLQTTNYKLQTTNYGGFFR